MYMGRECHSHLGEKKRNLQTPTADRSRTSPEVLGPSIMSLVFYSPSHLFRMQCQNFSKKKSRKKCASIELI